MPYAYVCDACGHATSSHLLKPGGDFHAGPYVCGECGCETTLHATVTSTGNLRELENERSARKRAEAAVERVRKLHAATVTHLVAEIDGFGGEQREIEPDSFEEITSREVVCMACVGYPEAPCPTLQALDEAGNGAEDGTA